ncbi:hypothetical protein ACJOMQ_03805, partial [Mycoplasmopsis synoviae]|uniref:hypothetical protein n=1 Tax=Mycoplasmopsis synoviae TaxID=2109 RepID=UPI00387B2F9C
NCNNKIKKVIMKKVNNFWKKLTAAKTKAIQKQNQASKNKKQESLIEMRLEEINNAILAYEHNVVDLDSKEAQMALSWYKRQLFLNLLGAGVTILLMVFLLVLAYLLGGIV